VIEIMALFAPWLSESASFMIVLNVLLLFVVVAAAVAIVVTFYAFSLSALKDCNFWVVAGFRIRSD